MSALRLTFRRDVFTLSADNQRHDWRWTLTASNGRIVGCSSEAYVKRIDAVKNAALVLDVRWADLAADVRDYSPNDGPIRLFPPSRPIDVEVQR